MARNVIQFCRVLRRAGLDVTLAEVIDSLRAVREIDLADRDDFYWALRAVLTSQPEDGPVFDELFESFWTFQREPEVESEEESQTGLEQTIMQILTREECSYEVDFSSDRNDGPDSEEEAEIALYSPMEALSTRDFSTFQADELEQMARVVQILARRLATWRGRRTRPSHRRRLVDPRRTVRANLKYGGTVVNLAYKERKIKKPRLVLICDVSRSMDTYSRFLLQFIYTLQTHLGRVESFVFSTSLTRVTDYFRGRDIMEALEMIAREVPDWSGGTRIGQSLARFNAVYGRRLVGRRTIVLILSDGLDTGDVELLDRAMDELKHRAARVIWLNPLLGSQEYRPLARGMRAALPHVDVFAPAHNLASLQELGRHLCLAS